MLWGTFSLTHIITLFLSAAMIIGLYFILKNKSEKVKTIVLFVLSLTGACAIVWNLVTWGSPLEYLPFHMCSITAMILPFAVLTKKNVLGNLLLLWCLGALLAVVVNFAQANYEIFSMTFIVYYFPHTFEFGIPILMFAFGMVKFRPKYILSTLALTFIIYTGVHLINVAVNDYCLTNNVCNPNTGELIQVNYMYSITPANPVLQLFWMVIPYAYWYMYLGILVIAIYLCAIWLGWWLYGKHKQKRESAQA